jgi:hypothetical protein
MSRVDAQQLADSLFEERPYAVFYWYHWPRDGIFPWEDFEPVVYIYGDNDDNDDDSLCLVVLRVGWKYKAVASNDLTHPIEVLFETPQHHPLLRRRDNFRIFDARKDALEQYQRDFVRLQRPLPRLTIEGPAMYRRNIYEEISKLRTDNCQ